MYGTLKIRLMLNSVAICRTTLALCTLQLSRRTFNVRVPLNARNSFKNLTMFSFRMDFSFAIVAIIPLLDETAASTAMQEVGRH